jgi:hypothetical protein
MAQNGSTLSRLRPSRHGYNRIVRVFFPLLLIVSLAGCQHGGANSTEAVRQGVIDRLSKGGYNLSAMDIQVASVQFKGEEADATISLSAKGQANAAPMTLRYHLEHQNGKWVVTGYAKDNAHGSAADPNMGGMNPGGTNPHGGAMPPAAAGADNPHGGMPPSGGGAMPSPSDLPPASKK